MPNKKTAILTTEQYEKIILTIRNGGPTFRPNNRIATCLSLEANLGIRIEDIIKMCLCDIIKDGDDYLYEVENTKDGNIRSYTIPFPVYQYIQLYCLQNNIIYDDPIFPVTVRAIQKHLKLVSEYLGYENVGTQSFRKFFANQIYINNEYNLKLVQQLLQHSSIETTKQYLGVTKSQMKKAINNNLKLI